MSGALDLNRLVWHLHQPSLVTILNLVGFLWQFISFPSIFLWLKLCSVRSLVSIVFYRHPSALNLPSCFSTILSFVIVFLLQPCSSFLCLIIYKLPLHWFLYFISIKINKIQIDALKMLMLDWGKLHLYPHPKRQHNSMHTCKSRTRKTMELAPKLLTFTLICLLHVNSLFQIFSHCQSKKVLNPKPCGNDLSFLVSHTRLKSCSVKRVQRGQKAPSMDFRRKYFVFSAFRKRPQFECFNI